MSCEKYIHRNQTFYIIRKLIKLNKKIEKKNICIEIA